MDVSEQVVQQVVHLAIIGIGSGLVAFIYASIRARGRRASHEAFMSFMINLFTAWFVLGGAVALLLDLGLVKFP
jgi:hypothetical protein